MMRGDGVGCGGARSLSGAQGRPCFYHTNPFSAHVQFVSERLKDVY